MIPRQDGVAIFWSSSQSGPLKWLVMSGNLKCPVIVSVVALGDMSLPIFAGYNQNYLAQLLRATLNHQQPLINPYQIRWSIRNHRYLTVIHYQPFRLPPVNHYHLWICGCGPPAQDPRSSRDRRLALPLGTRWLIKLIHHSWLDLGTRCLIMVLTGDGWDRVYKKTF